MVVAEREIWDVRHGGGTVESGGEDEECDGGAKKVGEEESIVNWNSIFLVCLFVVS